MPWKVQDLMSSRQEFVALANQTDANITQLCRRFGISRKTGNKWLARHRAEGESGLRDRSRRPRQSPERTDAEMEDRVLAVRREHPAWGGRKIRAYLCQRGVPGVPAPSTMTAILQRHGAIDPREAAKHRPFVRFERSTPNELWQMDFKGWFTLGTGGRCYPLTILDDHSRYSITLKACGDERGETVQQAMTAAFRKYGMPHQVLADNGSPWGSDAEHRHTWLTVWLLRLGIRVSHGRPYHPQTQGKEERFHRTLKAEVLRGREFRTMDEAADRFSRWRDEYNCERPHEALGMAVPASRYRVSERRYPEELPPIEYGADDEVRKIQRNGELHYRGVTYMVSKAFVGQPVALRKNAMDEDRREVWFCQQPLGHLNLRTEEYERRTVRREG